MADQPSPSARQGPRPPAAGATPLAERGPIENAADDVANPLPPTPTVLANGRALYENYCVPCHGANGSASDAAVAKYFPRVGDLTSPEIQQHGDGWLYRTITNGTPAMPAYGHELDADERWKIVRYVRTLAR
jgi:mono/diheme cytochrome c family protein